MNAGKPSMLKSTLIGGGTAGVVGAIPIVGALNCLCCSLVIGGGFLAAYLYANECRRGGVEFRPGNGATVGLIAALFYAIGTTVIGLLLRLVMPAPDLDQVRSMLEGQNIPPEAMSVIDRFLEMSTSAMGQVFGFLLWLVLGAIFSTIGGLIGGAAFKVEPQTPPAPPSTQV